MKASIAAGFFCVAAVSANAEDSCLKDATSTLKQIDEQLTTLRKREVSTGGPRTQPLGCTMRLIKVAGTAEGAYVGGPEEAKHHNEISCLELNKIYIRRACDCRYRKLAFSSDEKIVDESIRAYKRVKDSEKKVRSRAIKNPLIKKWVDEASKVRDCYSEETIKSLNNTTELLEKLFSDVPATGR